MEGAKGHLFAVAATVRVVLSVHRKAPTGGKGQRSAKIFVDLRFFKVVVH